MPGQISLWEQCRRRLVLFFFFGKFRDEKTESLFLPGEHMRDIFTRSGIVRPAILVDGKVAGWWNLKNRKLYVTLLDDSCKETVAASAGSLWKDLRKIGFR